MKKDITAITIKGKSETITLRQLPTIRQAFFVAATLVFAGVALAALVHPLFITVTLLVGFGLLVSALLGVCPMLVLLERMPWNK